MAFSEHRSDFGGFAGLFHSSEESPSLLFARGLKLWGRGYVGSRRSGASSCVECYGLEGVVADVDEPNTASIRVLEKLA